MFNDCNYSSYISIWLLLNQWTKLPLGSRSSGTLQGCHSLVQCLTNPSGSDWSPWSISLWSARCQPDVNLICTSKRNNRVELSHLRCLTVDQYVEADHRKCQPIILRKMHVHMCGIVPFLLLVRFWLSYIWGNKQYVSCHCL